MKRKIDLKKIKGVTIGTLGSEFVIHVPEEYDYRYSSTDRFLFIFNIFFFIFIKFVLIFFLKINPNLFFFSNSIKSSFENNINNTRKNY